MTNIIGTAYDAIAANYESQLAPAQWIRERLWKRMDLLFPAGSRILDVTAGTGLDAFHLAERDVSVVACDLSPHMLDILLKRNLPIKAVVSNFNLLPIHGQFDGIISTFAGLNTSPDLKAFATQAARLLRPNGTLFIHLLNRWPILDIMRQIIRFQWLNAWSTISMNPRKVIIGNFLVHHYLYSPFSLHRSVFAPCFKLSHLEGQGFIRPLNDSWWKQSEGLERRFASRFPFYSLGVFFSLELIRVN